MTDEYTSLAAIVVAQGKLIDALLVHCATQALAWPVITVANYDRACAAQEVLEPHIEKRLKELLS